MGALLPLLERVAVQPQEAEAGPCETHDLVGPELTSGHNTQGLLLPLGKSSGECPSHSDLGEKVLVWWLGLCVSGFWHTLDQPLPSSWWPAEERMERNAVAAFLLMLRSFLQGHTVNQESLVQCQGPAIIGALLRKVRHGEQVEERQSRTFWTVGPEWAGLVVRMWAGRWFSLWQEKLGHSPAWRLYFRDDSGPERLRARLIIHSRCWKNWKLSGWDSR